MGDMEDLCVTDCTRCPALVDSRSRIVNGGGPEDADLLFVGEGPGANEDEQGEPFVGRSGTVLDDGLRTVGLDRSDVRITNCVRCRPPENRDPKTDELANCRGYLEREIELLDPDVIVTLGKVPSEHLLGRSVAVTKEAGTLEEVRIEDAPRRLLICVHPAATLYDRSQEETFENALQRAAELAGVADGESGQTRLDGF
ncbi:uracil-DNA glycosylase [Natrinema salifodinae]|uniref:Type-4 uracil-DNA glycosylase n=1 Tax=Natrinema salifodinae TaxID=1202768 RepID=A0A1I0PAS3_9EURY|nr:uracil-DNA glycosylase [Natrinema salifodinae]SEW11320.1 DNA polymerase [Natrinema salifodinae]